MMVAIIISAIFQATFGSEFYSKFAIPDAGGDHRHRRVAAIRPDRARLPCWRRRRRGCEAAQGDGFRAPRIMFRHILPNCLSPILVISTRAGGGTPS